MPLKTFLEFGSILKKNKRIYEQISGDLYDTYMMARYFKDIYILETSKNLKSLYNNLHHKKDIKINFVNYLIIVSSKKFKFYEFGQTLFEKIYYVKIFNKILKKNINLKKIIWNGNDISRMFNFFCRNFFKDYKLNVFEKPNNYYIKDSIFFSKGVTLLYEKNNLKLLRYVFNKAHCGSFDFSICKNKKVKYLNTGYKLHYPSIEQFIKIIPKNKLVFFKNIKKDKEFIYFEVIFGNKKTIMNYFQLLKIIKIKNSKNNFYKRVLDLNVKFHNLDEFHKYLKN